VSLTLLLLFFWTTRTSRRHGIAWTFALPLCCWRSTFACCLLLCGWTDGTALRYLHSTARIPRLFWTVSLTLLLLCWSSTATIGVVGWVCFWATGPERLEVDRSNSTTNTAEGPSVVQRPVT